MISDRPPIPEKVKQEVRKRCGFGCVICGVPLYHYDHIVEYSTVRRHESNNITLLCAKHHDEKTRGLLDRSAVQVANNSPHNRTQGVSTPHVMHYSGNRCIVAIGSVLFYRTYQGPGTTCNAVVIDCQPMVAFTLEAGGNLLLTVNLYDQHQRRVLSIDRSQLVYSLHSWDIKFIGTRLTINSQRRDILLQIRFKVPDRIIIERGQFMYNGVDVIARKEYLAVTNKGSTLGCTTVHEAQIGLAVGASLGTGINVPIKACERYVGGGYSHADRKLVESRFRAARKGE